MTYEQRELNRLVHLVPSQFKEIETLLFENKDLCAQLYKTEANLTYEEQLRIVEMTHQINAIAAVAREHLEREGIGDKKRKIFMLEHLKFWK